MLSLPSNYKSVNENANTMDTFSSDHGITNYNFTCTFTLSTEQFQLQILYAISVAIFAIHFFFVAYARD